MKLDDEPIDHELVQKWLNQMIATDKVVKRIQKQKDEQINRRLNILKKKAWERYDRHRSKIFRQRLAKAGVPVQPQEMDLTRRFS